MLARKNYPDKKGTLYVIGHGTPESISDDRKGRLRREDLNPNDLAEVIRNSGLWQEGNPIELWGCAMAGGGESSFASNLANLLGVPVKGFEDNIWIYDLHPRHSSKMVEFLPDGKN